MFHSHWEMEVFAREIQQVRMREAERERRIVAARGAERRPAFVAAAERAIGALRAVISGQPARQIDAAGRGAMSVPELAFEAVSETSQASRPRVNPLTAPYATMVVVARGPAATTAAQPSQVGNR